MSRVISFRDLQIIPELSQYNEIELLHPSMDAKMNSYLEQLGFNTDAPVEYIPNKHRDIRGVVATGFRAVGTIDVGSSFLDSRMATMEDRIMAVFYTDPSLARELAQMLNAGISFVDADMQSEEDDEFPDELIEPDYEEVDGEIKTLLALRDSIRGPSHNDAGAPKTPAEFKSYQQSLAIH